VIQSYRKGYERKEPHSSKCLAPEEGEGGLSSSKVSIVQCATLLPFKAKEKKLWMEDWLEELELAQRMTFYLEEVAR